MNPFFILTTIFTLLGRKRTCPKCGRGQIVAAGKKHETSRCKFCGADMFPSK